MEFAILGPLEVRHAGQVVDLPAARQRRILAALLITPGGRLSVDRLVEACWDGTGPWTARKQVQNQVAALRRHLARHGGGTGLVTTRPDGYQLDVPDGDVDARKFTEAVKAARTANTETAIALYRSALALWRGPVLDGVQSPALEPAAARLTELRLTALEECYDLELRVGRHRQATADLIALAAEHPGREQLQTLLIRALHGAGRQVEAFEVYRRLHDYLATELGSRPSAEFRQLWQRLLCEQATDSSAVSGQSS